MRGLGTCLCKKHIVLLDLAHHQPRMVDHLAAEGAAKLRPHLICC